MAGQGTATGTATDNRRADFGFRDVRPGEKATLVREVFDSVAPRYDLMNDLMSAGVHRLWKAAMVDALAPRPGLRLLDVAGGTGDIAFRVYDRLAGRAEITVCDINPAMLEVGRARALDRGILDGIDWIEGDAEALPFDDMAFDGCTIAFGLRNVTRKGVALGEMRRVLRPGGKLVCLEFSHVVAPLLGPLYERWSFDAVPWLGGVVAGDRPAYEYLVESIRRFPDAETLSAMMREAGLDLVRARPLSGGIAALHTARRL